MNFQSGNGGIVLDVSSNGLGFQAVEPLQTSESLPFRLFVPGFSQVILSGRIAWLDETRRRGGLRVIVPAPQQRAFEHWQRQYLGPPPGPDQPAENPRPAALASEPRPESKPSRISRNVLAACLLVALCAALADASQLLLAARRAGYLLSHLGRKFSGATQQGVSAAALPSAIPPSISPAPQPAAARAAILAPYAVPSAPPVPAAQPAQQSDMALNLIRAQLPASPPRANSLSAPPLAAKVSPADVSPAVGDILDPNSPRRVPKFQLAERQTLQRRSEPHVSALAVATTGPRTSRAAALSPIAAEEPVDVNAGSPDPSPAASQPLASAAPAYQALDSQTVAPSENFQPCQLVDSVQPTYPKEARKQRVQGGVELRLVVGTDGAVRNVSAVSGPPLLVAAAVNAARQFHYKPALLNAKPIETIQTVTVSFQLHQQ